MADPIPATGDVPVIPVTRGQWYRVLIKDGMALVGIFVAFGNSTFPDLARMGVKMPPWVGIVLMLASKVYDIYSKAHDQNNAVAVDHSTGKQDGAI